MTRIVYGNTNSENGWPMVNRDECDDNPVPGTSVVIPLQRGQPNPIMKAFAADFNIHVQPLRQGDCGGWTGTNSVSTSNHLSGTAMDLNWNSHPFHVRGTFTPEQMATLRDILAFYENTIFWGGDWDDPIDEMHFQMGYQTFNNPHTQDFINRKILPNGFSLYRRGAPPPPPPPPALTRAERYALTIIQTGQGLGITPRGIVIALSVALVETNLTMYANSNDPASLNFPHDAVGSDHMSSGLFQQQPPWGSLADRMDPAASARIFFTVDNGPGVRGLTKIRDGNGNLYDYNNTSHTQGFYAQKVQGSAFPDRYDQRMDEAERLYNRLAGVVEPGGDDMASVPQEQWDALYHAVMNQRHSRSPLRELDEGDVGDMPDQIWDMDGSIHILVVYLLASLGHPGQLALLNRVANADPVRYPDRQADREVAQAILAEVAASNDLRDHILAALGRVASVQPAAQLAALPTPAPPQPPQVVYLPAPVEPSNGSKPKTTGETISDLYSALESLRLADALPIEGRAPLAALISVLQTKNGSQV